MYIQYTWGVIGKVDQIIPIINWTCAMFSMHSCLDPANKSGESNDCLNIIDNVKKLCKKVSIS